MLAADFRCAGHANFILNFVLNCFFNANINGKCSRFTVEEKREASRKSENREL